MKIAQIAPVNLPIPANGGVERVVLDLTEELRKRGHQVTIFCSTDSTISGKKSYEKSAPGNYMTEPSAILKHLTHLSKSLLSADKDFDIIHSHVGYLPLFFAPFLKKKVVTTLHNPLYEEYPERIELLKQFNHPNLISISKAQVSRYPEIKFLDNVYNGVNTKAYKPDFACEKEDYLLWVGRFISKKGANTAIRLAKKTGKKLILIGKIDPQNNSYFNNKILPHVDGQQIILRENKSSKDLAKYYQKARALLVPNHWEEPFGLVAVEAMACGTPVIGFDRGAMQEIVIDNENGYLCPADNINSMEKAIKKLYQLNKGEYENMSKFCSEFVLINFSSQKMTDRYEKIYRDLVSS